jgi:hypothetical protein
MADISLQLDTTEYPLTVVDGTTLTLSFNGAAGPSGPNTITSQTTTSLSTYANEAAAVTANLSSGTIYKTYTGELRIKL